MVTQNYGTMDCKYMANSHDNRSKEFAVDLSLYWQLIGSLMYLENTQPDNYDIQLHEFIDSDWVGSTDDKRSATWICFNLRFSMMSWASRKQRYWIQPWYIVMIRAIWSLQRKPVFYDRPKYIEIKHYILRHKVHKREVVSSRYPSMSR